MQLLTVNPDRMTRRSAEVDEIRDFFVSTGGCWYTQGLIQEGRNITDWHIVEGDLIPLIKKQLDLGRQRALHGGYYGRRNKIMTRINDAVDRLDAIPTQIYAAAAMMGHFVETHGIQRVCLITRTGPTFQAGKQNTIDPSIIRQSCFLNTMFGACQFPDPNQVLRLELAGYSSGEVMGHLERLPQHARIDGVWVKNVKTLVVTTSIDRLVGSTAEYARFMQMCREKGHSGISMFWDHETEPDVLTALHLDNSHAQNPVVVAWEKALKGQKRAPSHNLNLPLLQPFVWALGHEQSLPAADHASRHVRNVETYRSAMKTSMYQGSDLIAHALSERSVDSQGLSDERIKA
ncbi:uncharacterized protein RCC_07929 [Ramularia collo-cygni]|uniref:Uncharacterized protein n=1 Tax=Ramularia collo-cygni TaxID=112498 RepID=A0A2D3V9D3_9PEZI|nr:uncharacterized protein RCC_07929 [Ramularia collo-cygni]CZT22060.1 uncharacterized protein RCC_07929 [Ramularia collo-cygni]